MLRPLSFFTYAKHNKRKISGMITSIALSVLLIGVIELYANNMNDTYDRGNIQFNYISYIESTKNDIPRDITDRIKNSGLVENMIPVNEHEYMIWNVIGSDTHYNGYYADEKDIELMMDKMKLKLMQGSIPKNGEKKILINENIARSKKLKIGDYMGRDVREDDYYIPGKYQVCGIIKGDNIVSFISVERQSIENKMLQQYQAYILIPQKGKLQKLNSFLSTIPKKNIRIVDYEQTERSEKSERDNFNIIFNLLTIVMIVVLSVSLGNSSYVHYFQRRKEFGLLLSIGCRKYKILSRIFKEICISCFIGFAAGFLILYGFKTLENIYCIYPKGLSPFIIKGDFITRILSIPLFICIFSLIPVSRLLSKIEPISIIERIE